MGPGETDWGGRMVRASVAESASGSALTGPCWQTNSKR